MARIPFSQVLKDASIDISKEFHRLYTLFYKDPCVVGSHTLRDVCDMYFYMFPYRGTCLSLKDFECSHGLDFTPGINKVDFDHLVSFCEYTYNLASYNHCYCQSGVYR